MAKVSKTVHCLASLTGAEIRAILVEWFATQRQGCVVIPKAATFELGKDSAHFSWREGDNG